MYYIITCPIFFAHNIYTNAEPLSVQLEAVDQHKSQICPYIANGILRDPKHKSQIVPYIANVGILRDRRLICQFCALPLLHTLEQTAPYSNILGQYPVTIESKVMDTMCASNGYASSHMQNLEFQSVPPEAVSQQISQIFPSITYAKVGLLTGTRLTCPCFAPSLSCHTFEQTAPVSGTLGQYAIEGLVSDTTCENIGYSSSHVVKLEDLRGIPKDFRVQCTSLRTSYLVLKVKFYYYQDSVHELVKVFQSKFREQGYEVDMEQSDIIGFFYVKFASILLAQEALLKKAYIGFDLEARKFPAPKPNSPRKFKVLSQLLTVRVGRVTTTAILLRKKKDDFV